MWNVETWIMLELNRSYEARFLGRQLVAGAVTSDLLCRLVHELPETIAGCVRCVVQCNASGLSVSRAFSLGQGEPQTIGQANNVLLKVPLSDILFCHVDKGRPEVTVWVVRAKDEETTVPTSGGSAGNQPILQAYIYRCLNPTDAVGLFKVYNEINRQAKFDKYRRNGEKKEEVGGRQEETRPESVVDSADSLPAVTVLSTTNVKTEVKKLNTMAAAAAITTTTTTTTTTGTVSANRKQSSQEETDNSRNSSPTWSSIVGNIANYRRSFRILRPRDKEVRAALLEELREKLRTRDKQGNVDVVEKADSAEQTNKSKPENRQRKPVKTIAEKSDGETTSPATTTTITTTKSGSSFQFPWSNAVKKLVHKKRNNGHVMTSTLRPTPLPVPESHTPVWYLPAKDIVSSNGTAKKGGKSRWSSTSSSAAKGLAPLPPSTRLVSTGADPYFYLPPLPMIHEASNSAPSTSRTELYVPMIPNKKNGLTTSTPSFRILGPELDHRKHYSYPTTHRYCNANQHHHHYQYNNGYVTSGTGSGVRTNKKAKPGHPNPVYGIGRFTRANHTKKRTPSANGNTTTFYRTSSTGSRGSTSSDSGQDNRLRSVMKKPKQANENTPPEQKKNVTFHAYATVQLMN